MNSVVQSLSNIQEFSSYFTKLQSVDTKRHPTRRVHPSRREMNGKDLSHENDDTIVVEELRKLLISLSDGGDGTKSISPECLFLVIWKVVPQFRGHRQHDAHEFLRSMLDRLHTELQYLGLTGEMGVTPLSKLAKFLNSTSTGEPSSGSFKGRGSIVTNVFGGTLLSEVSFTGRLFMGDMVVVNLYSEFGE